MKSKLDNSIFILGAGASVPYGYPTANQLRAQIIKRSNIPLTMASKQINFEGTDSSMWFNRFKPIINSFDASNTESIDLFLTRNKGKIDIEAGIFLIMYSLIWYELQYKNIRFDEDWYFAFYNELTREITEKDQLFYLRQYPIQFITFNYDRSLEHFLYTSLKNSFTLDADEAKTIYNKLFNVYHVYGKIAELEWENVNGIKYSDDDLYKRINELKNNIKLVYDDRAHITDVMKGMLLNSKRIYLLGFGFAKANLDKLDLKNLLTKDHKLFATGLNLYDSQVLQIKQMLMHGLVGIKEHNIQIEQSMNSLQLLQSHLF